MKQLYFDQLYTGTQWLTNGVLVEIDAAGNLVSLCESSTPGDAERVPGIALPGMPNLHCHAHQRVMAGLAEWSRGDDNFWSWRQLMYRVVNQITPEQLQVIAAQLYMEMLQQGYTAVAEFQYLHHDLKGKPYTDRAEMSLRSIQAAEQVGIGMTCLPVLYSYSNFAATQPGVEQRRFINNISGFMPIVESLQQATKDNQNFQVGVAPHSLRAVSHEQLKELVEITAGIPRHIHIAEQQKEVEACLAAYGQRPVAWLQSNIELNADWCLIHATHLDADETTRLARSEVTVGLCPTTEANLGDGFFPIHDYQQQGGLWGIGSDSNVSLNPTEELRWLEYGQRLQHQQRNVLGESHTGTALVAHALRGGARACGRAIGSLQPGYRADIIVLDQEHPLLYGRHASQLLDSWVFAHQNTPINHVMVGGHWQIRDGHHINEQQITTQFKQVIDALSLEDL
ncbi:MAG: formimidoylglutamate deiminase [Gammaproteobacteria bacterium]|nr:formimidoylglutamate deiminase [Gammaproteobacteria bacterium]